MNLTSDDLFVGFRVDKRLAGILDEVCQLRGENRSNFMRRALRKELAELSYLDPDEKKALGVTVSPELAPPPAQEAD